MLSTAGTYRHVEQLLIAQRFSDQGRRHGFESGVKFCEQSSRKTSDSPLFANLGDMKVKYLQQIKLHDSGVTTEARLKF
jgi:hypothetical protein